MKKSKLTALIMAVCVLIVSGCGSRTQNGVSGEASQVNNENNGSEESTAAGTDGRTLGRYVEEAVEFPGELMMPLGLFKENGIIRLNDTSGEDLLSADQGNSFEYANDMPDLLAEALAAESYFYNMTVSSEGDRILSEYIEMNDFNSFHNYIITADNQVIELSDLSSTNIYSFYGSDCYFYVLQDKKVYQVNAKTGETLYLFETENYASYAAADDQKLYVLDQAGIQIYDLENKELLDQDTVLNEFIKNKTGRQGMNAYRLLLSPNAENNGVYVVAEEGLYFHTLNGSVMEQIIDGSLCSIGDITKSYVDMVVLQNQDNDSYLILYSDGSLMRYTYDATIPTVPDTTLRVYSVYEDTNVKQAISGFQQLHPELYVKYEVGIAQDSGVTLEDALKNLSTELAAGKGPDIMMMDNIPYDSYVDKGVLMDLSSMLTEMSGEQFFDHIIDNYKTNSGLYTIPAVFSFPVISGDGTSLEGLASLSDLAGLLEEARAKKPEGSIFSFINSQELLRLLAQSSFGIWISEDGSLNKDAIVEFLTQSKRIYDAQMEGLTQDEIESSYSFLTDSFSSGNALTNRFQSDGAVSALSAALFNNQPYSGSYLSGTMEDYSTYLAMLKSVDADFIMMPGQNQGTCIPASLISVNNDTGIKEKASEFVKYMLSGEFQSGAYLTGSPINQTAYYAKQENPYPGVPEGEAYAVVGMTTSNDDGVEDMLTIEIFWPSKEEFQRMDDIVEGLTEINTCDDRVFQAVLELGDGAITGDTGIEEAANAIEKKVQLYLAE